MNCIATRNGLVIIKSCKDHSKLSLLISSQDGSMSIYQKSLYKDQLGNSVEIYAIIGLLQLEELYLVAVTEAKCVGRIRGSKAWNIGRVVTIPLQYDAALPVLNEIKKSHKDVVHRSTGSVLENYYTNYDTGDITAVGKGLVNSVQNIGVGVINSLQSGLGKSRQGLNSGNLSNSEDPTEEVKPVASSTKSSPKKTQMSVMTSLFKSAKDKKILMEIMNMLSSGLFYYSDVYNITRTCQYQAFSGNTRSDYWDDLDERFFWNKHILSPFLKMRLHEWVMPIIQGFIHVEECQLEERNFTFIMISRRSRFRCGLRYQRRGADEEGNVANFVETEQILIFEPQGERNTEDIMSFVQVRGSIPLHWSQSAQSRKPLPVVRDDSIAQNEVIMLHTNKLKTIYGPLTMISLVESEGRESLVGEQFGKYARSLETESKDLKFVEFDIHKVCKGMKFENLKLLLDSLESDFNRMNHYWKSGDEVFSQQKGVFRTNCMDCLDRTNVVQAAIARQIINLQLLRLGIHSYPERGLKYYADFELLFNNAWANNGDAISMAYTRTSALKGDVTRTGKRNVQGLVNDGASSIMRLYHNNFKDAYRQTVINFLLGLSSYETLVGKEEYTEERHAQSPTDSSTISNEYDEAIKTAVELVLGDGDQLNASCIVLAIEISMIRASRVIVTEKVFLLTPDSYYLVFYDYFLDKVTHYKRVLLKNVRKLQKGTLYLDSKTENDSDDNYGICIWYEGQEEELRTSTTVFNHAELIRMFSNKKHSSQTELKRDIFKIPSSKETSRVLVEQLASKIVLGVIETQPGSDVSFVQDEDLTPTISTKKSMMQRVVNSIPGLATSN